MDFYPVDIKHLQIIEDIRQKYRHDTSSHAFQLLYLWREVMGLTVAVGEDFFVVRSTWRGENAYFFPCGDSEKTRNFLQSHVEEENFRLCYMRRCDVLFLQEQFPGRFEVSYDRDACEYLYGRAEQAAMIGSEFIRLRTKLHHLEREYRLECFPLTAENAGEAGDVTLQWADRHVALPKFNDVSVTLEALSLLDALGLSGILAYINGKPTSFAIGCPIAPSVYDLCLMKHCTTARGMSSYVLRDLCRRLPEKYSIINLEEDLGIEGLKTHKEELRPIGLVGIWEGKPKAP